jgi:hypothetical protein
MWQTRTATTQACTSRWRTKHARRFPDDFQAIPR